ncbi:Ca-activated chloride channel family protein [Catalinimonas alkaloidigena]|uniref:VWA domain-containing protein n=1 Tax=Catalinimonas alkaloidigena TaxID=1075417 RepID=UPI0024052379|nr:VWA domain-containing protein [Catalinimonas alkaloidigena]MDF9799069.1 Ca-activated chloride channel family protein [Catalinimonas alkaloidigena]
MEWYHQFGKTEFVFIGLFILGYVLYISRMIRISRILNTGFPAIVAKVVLRTLYFLLFMVALLGPLMGNATKEVQAVGKDIFVAVDLSQSMNATDVQPSRLEKVKYELRDLVKAFSSDRIGLIIFSSEAFVQCPLTYDQSALNLFIETLNTGLVPNTGTDFGPPLRMALSKLDSDESIPSQQKSKVIILISDGEDFGDETSDVSQEIKNAGIKLFTLGVGTQDGSQILVRGVPKTDSDGNVVVTKLESSSLKQLADETGGQYFEVNDRRDDSSRLINAISQIEGELRDSRQVDTSSNKYLYFLVVGAVLFAVDHLFKFKTVKI